MKAEHIRSVVGVALILLLGACAGPSAPGVAQEIPSSVPQTATSVPATAVPSDTPTPVPPTATSTSVPPTATSVTPTETPLPPTDAPTATPTVTATATRMPPTATRVRPTALPSSTATPAGPKYPAPVLAAPPNDFGYSCRHDLNLLWTWSGPGLGANEWFDVEFTKQAQNEWYSVAWVTDTQLTLHPQKGESRTRYLVIIQSPGSGAMAGESSAQTPGHTSAASKATRSWLHGVGATPDGASGTLYPVYPPCKVTGLPSPGKYEWKVRVVSGAQGSGKVDAVLSPDSQIWFFNYSS